MSGRWKKHALAVCLGVVASLAPAVQSSASTVDGVPACPQIALVGGLGNACSRPDGYIELFDSSGNSLGLTHGGDPVRPAQFAAASTAPPYCDDGPYRVQVVYARAYDAADRYGISVGPIRSGVAAALGLFNDAGASSGAGGALLRMRCTGGQVDVANAVLSTRKAQANPSTIIADLFAAGFNNKRTKYLVLYDDPQACGCAGIGLIYNDDRKSVDNTNNGNGDVQTAINFGYPSDAQVWMHELAHTLGAVQNSAPHSTGLSHCTDGWDTMCYNDAGPYAGSYTTGRCSTQIFDCGKDDYFNVDPAPGSYLDTYWNLADPYNRYLVMVGVPSIEVIDPVTGNLYVGCTSARIGTATPLFVAQGCVQVRVSAASGISSVTLKQGTQTIGTLSSPNAGDRYKFEFPVARGGSLLEVVARDSSGRVGRVRINVSSL